MRINSAAELTYPELFKTNFPGDWDDDYKMEMFTKGRDIAEEFGTIYIAANGGVYVQTTSPDGRVSGSISGLPVIGHHAASWALLWGMIDGISPIVYVDADGGETLVKGSGYLSIA